MVFDPHSVISLFTEVVRKLTNFVERFEFQEINLGNDIFLLDYIAQHPRCTISELASAQNYTVSTTSRHVARLTTLGLVCRTPDPQDRRNLHLVLTPKGAQAHRSFFEFRLKNLSTILGKFSPSEIKTITKVFQSFSDNIDEGILPVK